MHDASIRTEPLSLRPSECERGESVNERVSEERGRGEGEGRGKQREGGGREGVRGTRGSWALGVQLAGTRGRHFWGVIELLCLRDSRTGSRCEAEIGRLYRGSSEITTSLLLFLLLLLRSIRSQKDKA